MDSKKIKKITLIAIWTALSFVLGRAFTFVVPGSAGNILTLLDVGIYSAVFLMGKREAAVIGGLAAFLLDFTAGYSNYMFFSLIIHGSQGYLAGLTRSKTLNFALSLIVMVGGYFLVGWMFYGWASALTGLWVNVIQVGLGYILARLLSPLIRRTGISNGFAKN